VTCGLYEEICEFVDPADPFFKTTAIDHSAILRGEIAPEFAGIIHSRRR
jgi:hypothetical protein